YGSSAEWNQWFNQSSPLRDSISAVSISRLSRSRHFSTLPPIFRSLLSQSPDLLVSRSRHLPVFPIFRCPRCLDFPMSRSLLPPPHPSHLIPDRRELSHAARNRRVSTCHRERAAKFVGSRTI